MKIYTGAISDKRRIEIVKAYDMGFMISSCADHTVRREYSKVQCALDNGAFTCWQLGYPFQPKVFLSTIAQAYKHGITLDFIVCPDIVTQGAESLAYSLKWARGEHLETAPALAFVVQDGMKPAATIKKIQDDNFSHIFIGGSVEWKWKNAGEWIGAAQSAGMKSHVGRCGTIDLLLKARDLGADSVDSTNFTRNNSWEVIKDFVERTTGKHLFSPLEENEGGK